MQVAAIWARRGIALDRVPALVNEGLAALEARRKRQDQVTHSDLFSSPDRRLMEENNRWYADTNTWQTLVLAYSKTGKIAEARNVLGKWETALAERRKRAEEVRKQREARKDEPAPAAAGRSSSGVGVGPERMRAMIEDSLIRSLPYDESRYFDALAELALVEHRKLDALTFYQSGLRAMAGVTGAPADPAKSETGRKASDLWKELGGTQEGWQTWLDSLSVKTASAPGLPSRWSALNRALPEFKLADQAGKTWAVTNLKGKTTLINVWATWCGPCRLELPHLQKLHDKVKGRPDVQVITLNVDENRGLIEPFLKENNYTFPVLLARSFVDSFTGPLGIPTNWISDADASIRLESTGFGGDGDEWIQQTEEQMEKVKDGKTPGK
jgi:thiol-disulfide isomerase/thioredoxin